MAMNIPVSCERCPLFQEAGLFCSKLSLQELHNLSNESGPTILRRGKSLAIKEIRGFPVIGVGSGALSLQGNLRDGGKTITTIFKRGGIIDLRKFPDLIDRRLTALSCVEFCILSPRVFDKIISTNREAEKYVRENRGVLVSLALDARADTPSNLVRNKIASLILECYRRQITAFSSRKVILPTPPNQMAKYLGLQTEMVTDVIRELEIHKIIETNGVSSTEFVIRNLASLRQIARTNPPSRGCLA